MDFINSAIAAERGDTTPQQLYWVTMAESLERLERNDDFKRVILDGYFKDRAIDGVSLLAHDDTKRRNARMDVYESLIAVSQLQDHFRTIKALGAMMVQDAEMEAEDSYSLDEGK